MIHVITNRQLTGTRPMLDIIEQVVVAQPYIVQLRERDLHGKQLLELAMAASLLCHRQGVLLLVNDRVDIALAAGADGVHLGTGSIPITKARELLGSHRLIGVSCHSVTEAVQADQQGADYLLVGHIFATASKPGLPPRGLQLLHAIRAAVTAPIIAIGGITPKTLPLTIAAGAQGAAVMSFAMQAPDPARATAQLIEAANRPKGKEGFHANLP